MYLKASIVLAYHGKTIKSSHSFNQVNSTAQLCHIAFTCKQMCCCRRCPRGAFARLCRVLAVMTRQKEDEGQATSESQPSWIRKCCRVNSFILSFPILTCWNSCDSASGNQTYTQTQPQIVTKLAIVVHHYVSYTLIDTSTGTRNGAFEVPAIERHIHSSTFILPTWFQDWPRARSPIPIWAGYLDWIGFQCPTSILLTLVTKSMRFRSFRCN